MLCQQLCHLARGTALIGFELKDQGGRAPYSLSELLLGEIQRFAPAFDPVSEGIIRTIYFIVHRNIRQRYRLSHRLSQAWSTCVRHSVIVLFFVQSFVRFIHTLFSEKGINLELEFQI